MLSLTLPTVLLTLLTLLLPIMPRLSKRSPTLPMLLHKITLALLTNWMRCNAYAQQSTANNPNEPLVVQHRLKDRFSRVRKDISLADKLIAQRRTEAKQLVNIKVEGFDAYLVMVVGFQSG
jgi:hypothetical protein